MGCGRAHIGLLRMEIKHVNHKTSVNQISKASPMKASVVHKQVQTHVVVLCVVVSHVVRSAGVHSGGSAM